MGMGFAGRLQRGRRLTVCFWAGKPLDGHWFNWPAGVDFPPSAVDSLNEPKSLGPSNDERLNQGIGETPLGRYRNEVLPSVC